LIKDDDPQIRERVVAALIARKDRSALTPLRAIEQSATDAAIRAAAKRAADGLDGR
jgi:hypothetical protein